MAVSLDLSGDYSLVDNTEAVTFTNVGRDPAFDQTQEISAAHRAPVSLREAATSGGVYTRQDQIWRLPGALLQGRAKPGDKITPQTLANDADGIWTILEVSWDQLNQEWRCPSRNLALVNDLRDTVTIERHSGAQDEAATFKPDWYPLYSQVAARVQEISGAPDESLGRRGTVRTLEVTLDRRLVVTNRDRVIDDRTGEIFEITGWTNPDRIDELMKLQVTRTA